MAAEQLFSNILLGSRGGAVSGGGTCGAVRLCCLRCCMGKRHIQRAQSQRGS